MNGISVLIKDPPEDSLVPSTMWRHSEKMGICELGSGLSPDSQSAGILISDLQPPDLRNNVCCLSRSVYEALLQPSEQAKTDMVSFGASLLPNTFPHGVWVVPGAPVALCPSPSPPLVHL